MREDIREKRKHALRLSFFGSERSTAALVMTQSAIDPKTQGVHRWKDGIMILCDHGLGLKKRRGYNSKRKKKELRVYISSDTGVVT